LAAIKRRGEKAITDSTDFTDGERNQRDLGVKPDGGRWDPHGAILLPGDNLR